MNFFRDQEDFFEAKAASSPIMIYQVILQHTNENKNPTDYNFHHYKSLKLSQASVETANDYTKRNFVFRLHAPDGSEFLFGADSEEQQEEWVRQRLQSSSSILIF